MARTLEVVVSANIPASTEHIEKDIGKIQEKVNRSINVTASIKKIQIDKTAVNYIKNEIKKMFNTVTVDIDGNILGVGKGTATAVKKQTDAIQKAVSAAQKAVVDRVKAVNSLIAAEKKLISLSSQITNTYGDMPGSYMQDDEDVKAFISALDVYIQKSTVASKRTKVLTDALRTTWITYGKLDATQMHDLTQSLHMDAIADGSTDKIADMSSVLETLAVRLNRAKIVSSEFQHELADESAAQRFRNSVNQNIRKLEEFYEKHTKLRSNTAFSAEYSSIMEELNTALSSGDKSGAKMAADHLADYIHRAKEAGLTTDTLGEKIQKAYQKFGGWAIVSGTFMKVTQAIRDMINNVVTLDKNLIELKKVTDETSDSYDAFMQRTKNTAKEVGATMTDFVSATASWARLGYNLVDAENLAKASVIFKTVGDDVEDIDAASASLISTIQGFSDLSTNEVMRVLDSYNEVSNRFAISSGGIGEVLQRSASSMDAANNSLEETIALAAAMNTVVNCVPRGYGNIAA